MPFSSITFLCFFLPTVLGVYYLLPRRLRNLWIVVASGLFLHWGDPTLAWVILISLSGNYGFGLWLENNRDKLKRSKVVLGLAIVFNLSILGYFKYTNFLVGNVNFFLEWIDGPVIEWAPVALMLGVSFFTFHSLSYLIDVYRRVGYAQTNPIDFAFYILFFPQLIAGPIIRFGDVADQIASRRETLDLFCSGVQRFIIGLGKKVLIANTLAVPADTVFDGDPGTMAVSTVWLGIICYALQIYFDFSGYSDMAIGLARMFGIRFKENFNYPYIARTMSDFWRRWHISLSTWFRDYLYIPLGGNRVAPARVAFNLVLVFLLCGFWHGASWNFLVWGAYHGLFLMVERWGPMERFLRKIGWGGHVYTVLAVMGGWIFFRAHDMTEALEIWARAVGLNGQEGAMLMPWALLEIDERWLLVVGVIACLPVLPWLVEKIAGKGEVNNPAKVGWQVVSLVGLSLVWAVSFIQLTAGTFNPFIYFRF